MARKVNRLSVKDVAATKKPGYYPDGLGLYLRVSDTGSKGWMFRYKFKGEPHWMGLGSIHSVTLKKARDEATRLRALLSEGVDPLVAKSAQKAQEALEKANTISFQMAADRYIASHKAKWKNAKHADQWTNTLKTYCGPLMGNLPISEINTGIVVSVLEPIWTKKPETATRVRARIESVLDWATVRGYRTGENPARWRGHLQKLLPELKKKSRVKHHEALPYTDLGPFMEKLRAIEGISARALEFTILCAARTGEVIAAKPAEIDQDQALWTIPGSRMKSGREHRVPLSPRALEIAEAMLKLGGSYLFPGQKLDKHISNMTMLKYLQEKLGHEDLTVHGFRSTFRDWAAECTTYPREVCEMALAHVVSDQTEAAYRRGDLFDKRRSLMDDWANFCADPEAGKALKSAKVLPLRKSA